MSFYLKYFFVIVAIAAIFTAVLVLQTPLWVVIIFNVTLATLVVAALVALLAHFTLTLAFAAGVIASYCVRRSSQRKE